MPLSFIYKTVDACDISLDVHLPDSDSSSLSALPVLIWFHGGGLLQGTRKKIAPHLLSGVAARRYCLASVDYRLAPQVTIADIIEDALDAVRFVRRELSSRLDSNTIHATDIAVSGSSAGGYIAMLVSLRDAELRCCLAIYPISNPLREFFTKPQATLPFDVDALRPFLDESTQVMSYNEPTSARNTMYFYMLHSANLAELMHLTKAQEGDTSKFLVDAEIKRKGGLVCPMYIIHGNNDKFVDLDQSQIVVQALAQHTNNFQFEEVDGVDHLFDMDPQVDLRAMYDFLHSHWSSATVLPQAILESAKCESTIDNFTASTGTSASGSSEARVRTPSISSASMSSTSSSAGSFLSESDDDAEQQWASQVHELSLVLNLILMPLVGKYFGRQFAFWGWGKYMTWRHSYSVVRDKGMQRLSSIIVAGLA